jgi:hypothetical protein
LSHDCEFNEGNRECFLVGRLSKFSPGDKAADRQELFRRGNNARERTSRGNRIALDMFFIEPVPGAFDESMALRFDVVVPIAMKFREDVFKCKRAEMDQPNRAMLREKLAVFTGRPVDDIHDELKKPIPEDPAVQVWEEIPVGEGEEEIPELEWVDLGARGIGAARGDRLQAVLYWTSGTVGGAEEGASAVGAGFYIASAAKTSSSDHRRLMDGADTADDWERARGLATEALNRPPSA